MCAYFCALSKADILSTPQLILANPHTSKAVRWCCFIT